jgi:uncharacterized membrane protein
MTHPTNPPHGRANDQSDGLLPVQTPADALPRAGRALAILGLAGASVGLLAGFLVVGNPTQFLAHNVALPHERNVMTGAVLVGALLGFLAGAVPLLRRRRAALERVCRGADLCAPLCLAGLLPVLLSYRVWDQDRLTFLVLLGAAVLAAERLVSRSFAAMPVSASRVVSGLRAPAWRHAPTIAVVLGAGAYAAYFSYHTLLNHRLFGTYGFDLGINVNWCFNALHGFPFRAPVQFGLDGGNIIAAHATFAIFLWLPIFALKPGAEVLLVHQSVMMGLAAVPLYLFARTQIPRWPAALVALGYLLYAPLHRPNFYDFHEIAVALPWHFLLYWLIATKRLRWATLVVAILWGHREEVGVGTAFLGAFLWLGGARPRFGASLFVASLIWVVLDKFVIMPAAGTWWFASIYKDLIPGGRGSYGDVVQTILINPAYVVSTLLVRAKLVYFLHMFAPLAFLPLRRPLLALLVVPGCLFTLLTTGYPPAVNIGFQYTTHWIPYAFAAVVIALGMLGKLGAARLHGALCAVLLGIFLHSVTFGAVFQPHTFVGGPTRIRFTETEADKHLYAQFMRLVSRIPPEASVAASETEVPHIAARLDAYTLRFHHGDADYLLVRRQGDMNAKVLQEAFDRNDYGLLDRVEDTFFLFMKGHESAETRDALARLEIRSRRGKGVGP